MNEAAEIAYLASFRKLGTALQVTLRAGAEMLTPATRAELRQALSGGIASERGLLLPAASEAPPDLYYTLFAIWLCEALDAPIDLVRLKHGLDRQPQRLLDPVHRACHACLSARLPTPFALRFLRLLLTLPRDLLAGFRKPYTVFIAALTAEQCGWRLPWFPFAWWAPWNWRTTPQAAAVLALQALAGAALNRGRRAQEWLIEQQAETGGFHAAPQAPAADLLSTATARFALALAGWQETPEEARQLVDFVETCRTPTGLWASHPGLPTGDVEYTFYALLAIGAAFVAETDKA